MKNWEAASEEDPTNFYEVEARSAEQAAERFIEAFHPGPEDGEEIGVLVRDGERVRRFTVEVEVDVSYWVTEEDDAEEEAGG